MEQEATDMGITSVIPQAIMPKGLTRRNSIANPIFIGPLSVSSVKIQSRYLRPSMGSCHDLCKGGRKDPSEDKRRHSFSGKSLDKNIIRDKMQHQFGSLILRDRNKRVIKLGTSSSFKSHFSDRPESNKKKALPSSKEAWLLQKHINTKLETQKPTCKSVTSTEQALTPTSPENEQNQVEILNLSETKKGQLSEEKTQKPTCQSVAATEKALSPTSPENEPNPVEILNLGDTKKGQLTEEKIQKPTCQSITATEQALSPTSPENEPNQVEILDLSDTKQGQLTEEKTAFHLKISPEIPKISKQRYTLRDSRIDALEEPDIGEENTKKSAASVKPDVVKQKASSPVKKSIPSANSKAIKKNLASIKESIPANSNVIKQNLVSIKKSAPSAKSEVLKQNASSPVVRTDQSVKCAISLRSVNTAVKPISVLSPLRILIGRRAQETKITKNLGVSRTGNKKVLKQSLASVTPRIPGNGVLSMKERKYRSKNSASSILNQEKYGNTDHNNVIPEDKKLSYARRKSEKHRSSTSISYKKEEATECKVESPKDEDTRRHRRTATIHPVESQPTAQKLRFRKGKVMEVQPENNSPRRLRFRKGRIVGDNSNDTKVGKISGSRREMDGPVSNDPGLETETVVLRHQDTQDRRDSQGLFNDVIEETATKLAETRKSKVKALVGAFETVISLQ